MTDRPGSSGGLLLLTAALTLGACADRNVGQSIPADQLYFPIGLQVLGDEAAGQQLAVLSSNYDQRFQSQQVSLLDVDLILDGVLNALGTPDGEGACTRAQANGPVYTDGFVFDGNNAVLSRVRLPGVGGELVAVPASVSGHWLFTTSRLDSALIMMFADADGRLGCANSQEELIRNTDCTRRYITNSQAEDPFSVARGVGPNGPYIAVGHLFPYVSGFDQFGAVTFFDESALIAQATSTAPLSEAEDEAARESDIVSTSTLAFIDGLNITATAGIGAVAYAASHPRQALLVLSLRFRPELALNALEFGPAGEGSTLPAGTLVPVVSDQVRLDTLTNAIGGRGLAMTDDGRSVASLRFSEPGVTSNAGLLVVRVDGPLLESFPVLEVGSELGPPAVRPRRTPEGQLLAYAGDLIDDKIWIVDISRDIPRPAGEIIGRAPRSADGRNFFARVLDAPTSMAFATRADRTYAFVGNFANSTLAVLDVSESLPPQQHCVLARVGRDVDANGESELDRL